ncbi:MAG TPA: response regulator [Polyangiaceae bacterium]|nr:response regulator [Polyangiaceae bacterium]
MEFEPAEPSTDVTNVTLPAARVVVVDDDEDMRALVAMTLRREGMEVIEARNGLQVLDYVMRVIRERLPQPDLVVSDARMPGVNGISLLESLRGVGCSVPVVFMTAHGGKAFRENAARLGASDVLEKPLDSDALAEVVRKRLGR